LILEKSPYRIYGRYGRESLNYKFLLLLSLLFLTSCGQIIAFIGPAITAGSTGEIYRAAYSIGSDHLVKRVTGKTTMEHVTSYLDTE
jgi:hypothetical protein